AAALDLDLSPGAVRGVVLGGLVDERLEGSRAGGRDAPGDTSGGGSAVRSRRRGRAAAAATRCDEQSCDQDEGADTPGASNQWGPPLVGRGDCVWARDDTVEARDHR